MLGRDIQGVLSERDGTPHHLGRAPPGLGL